MRSINNHSSRHYKNNFMKLINHHSFHLWQKTFRRVVYAAQLALLFFQFYLCSSSTSSSSSLSWVYRINIKFHSSFWSHIYQPQIFAVENPKHLKFILNHKILNTQNTTPSIISDGGKVKFAFGCKTQTVRWRQRPNSETNEETWPRHWQNLNTSPACASFWNNISEMRTHENRFTSDHPNYNFCSKSALRQPVRRATNRKRQHKPIARRHL